MPRSKRDKKVSLTKTDKKGLAWKQHIIEDIRHCVQKYPNIFVFSVQNMRNNLLKELRQEWKKNSRFVFGKNRIMQLGLGLTKDDEAEPNLHKLSKRLQGQCGLLFTEETSDVVVKWAKTYSAMEYARSGFVATETVILEEGPLEDFSHAIEPHLRSLGMPTKLEKGVVALYKDFTVCEKDKVLTPEQARILKLIAKPMATFRLHIKCFWLKDGGFVNLDEDEDEDRKSEESSGGEKMEGDDQSMDEDDDDDEESS